MESLDHFSVDLYQKLLAGAKDGPSSNVFFSPLSISSALMLAYAGAKGSTQKEIAQALHFSNASDQELLDTFSKVISIFKVPEGASYSFSLANRAYVEKTAQIKPVFKSTISTKLQSTVGEVDFQHKATEAAKEINQWVEKQTNGKIKNLIPESAVNASTLLVLVNAIYFKGEWEHVFYEGSTTKEDFTMLDGTKSKVDMMEKWGERYRYFDNLDGSKNGLPPFHALAIPYENNTLSMLILLPRDNDGLPALEKALKADSFTAIKKSSEGDRKANLFMPKFKTESSYSLEENLKNLGIKDLFSSKADLSGIADLPLSVSAVVHKAFIDVDEQGTEAAAATGMMITLCSAPVFSDDKPPVEFRVDHPFMFAIRHEETGHIIFMGRVAKF